MNMSSMFICTMNDVQLLQICEESGTDLAQQVLKRKRAARKQEEKRVSNLEAAKISGTKPCSQIGFRF
jgi:hypothetical protein